MSHILSWDDALQVIVSSAELGPRIKQWIRFEPGTDNGSPKRQEFPINLERILPDQYDAAGNKLEKLLGEIWKDFFGIDEIGIHDNFFDLGATSLDLVQLNEKLQKVLKREISIDKLFTYSTLHSLARYLGQMETGTGVDMADREQERTAAVMKGKNKLKRRKMSVKEKEY